MERIDWIGIVRVVSRPYFKEILSLHNLKITSKGRLCKVRVRGTHAITGGLGGAVSPQRVQGRALAGIQGVEPPEAHEILPSLRP